MLYHAKQDEVQNEAFRLDSDGKARFNMGKLNYFESSTYTLYLPFNYIKTLHKYQIWNKCEAMRLRPFETKTDMRFYAVFFYLIPKWYAYIHGNALLCVLLL